MDSDRGVVAHAGGRGAHRSLPKSTQNSSPAAPRGGVLSQGVPFPASAATRVEDARRRQKTLPEDVGSLGEFPRRRGFVI